MKTLKFNFLIFAMLCLGLGIILKMAGAQETVPVNGPDPREIPLPRIKTSRGTLPGVRELPIRKEMPDVMVMNDGKKVASQKQWKKRREEMKRILEYYAIGQMPPPPGNVKGNEVQSETVLDGKIRYRLVHLTFGPGEKLVWISAFSRPCEGGPFPTIILQSVATPGAAPLPRLPQGPNQGRGQDVLLLVGPAPGDGGAGFFSGEQIFFRFLQRTGHRAIHGRTECRCFSPRLCPCRVQS